MTQMTASETLEDLRKSIDNIDTALIALLAERFHCTHKVGLLKARTHMPACDPQREHQQQIRIAKLAKERDLDPQFCEQLFTMIINEAVAHHKKLAKEMT